MRFHPAASPRSLLVLPLLTAWALPASAQSGGWSYSGAMSTVSSVDASQDFDGDGLADVVVGDTDSGSGGMVRLLRGTDGTLLRLLPFNTTDFGDLVVAMPDLSGDGRADLIVGDVDGRLRLFDGVSWDQFGVTLHASSGEWNLAATEDINGDGYPDLIGGQAGLANGVTCMISGRYLATGQAPVYLWCVSGSQAGGRFGAAVASAGDVNGDGVEDVVTGAPEEAGTVGLIQYHGRVHCLSGSNGALLWTRRRTGSSSTLFGYAIDSGPDVNGDGIQDVVIGAPYDGAGGFDAGAAIVVSGSSGAILDVLLGAVAGDLLGTDVAAVGDLDRDGIAEVVIGSSGASGGSGATRLFSGATMTPITGTGGGGHAGAPNTLSGGADMTGDGLPDFVVSWRGASSGGDPTVWQWHADCDGEITEACAAFPNSSGLPGTLTAVGSPSLFENDLTLVAADCPPNKPGLFFMGTQDVFVPFGDGIRCAGGQTKRLGQASVNASGGAQRVLNLTSSQFAGVTAGDERYFQLWFRDPMGPGGNGFNLTDSVRVRFCE